MGLKKCVLEAQDEVYDETAGTPTNLVEISGEKVTDDDNVAPEVTEEQHRLKTGQSLQSPEHRPADASVVRVQPEHHRTAG